MGAMSGRRRTALMAAGVAVALAGCGSAAASKPSAKGGKAPVRPAAVLTAYTRTTAAKTAKMTMDEILSGPGENITISGTGVVAFDNKKAEMTMSVPQAGTFTVRLISPQLYIELPAALRSKLPGGKAWLSLNLNTIARNKLGASLSQLSSSSDLPTQTLAYLQAVSTNGVHRVGTAIIRGSSTTEYEVTVDLTKEAANKTAKIKAAVKKLELELHRSTMPVQVWVDSQGRARQLRVQVPVSSPSGSSSSSTTGAKVTTTIDFYDFGAPLQVTVPPAAEVYNLTSKAVKS